MPQLTGLGRLSDKVAIVTGAAGGIGRAIAIAYANEGAKVIISTARNEKGLLETQSMAPKGSIAVRMTDASVAADVQGLVALAEEKFGRLDVMCNNAGIATGAFTADMPEQDWDRVIAVNLKGTFLGCKYAIPAMQKVKGGSIVNIGSINSFVGVPMHGHYCASKAGVLLLTKTVALEYAKDKIRANVICPGWIDTPMNEPYMEEMGGRKKMEEACLALQPLGLGKPEQVAAAAVFLASDESSLITGTDLLVDGGFTAQ
jgi:NAD(P)-dependent dehydrogenase (short-subunit alcohol dehydrogenase family)